MSTQVRGLLASGIGQLRHEPTAKRVRATLGGGAVVDSTRAVLVWEPRRIVPSYAVPDLAGYVVLDFRAFDGWSEEDEPVVAHPRDPFHRIDVLASSRHIRLELDGQVLAESSRPMLLFETMLPTRYYLPRTDIGADLVPSATQSYCAYKGRASYWSASVGGRLIPDLAWTYQEPLTDASRVGGLIAFFDERVDVVVDGQRRERPITPWSAGPRS